MRWAPPQILRKKRANLQGALMVEAFMAGRVSASEARQGRAAGHHQICDMHANDLPSQASTYLVRDAAGQGSAAGPEEELCCSCTAHTLPPQDVQPEVCGWFSGIMTSFESTPRKSLMRRRRGGGDDEDDEDDDGKELAMDHLSYDRVQV